LAEDVEVRERRLYHEHIGPLFFIEGGLTVRPLVLGVVDGQEIRLKDLWPSDDEIDAIVARAVKPEQFNRVYIPMFEKKESEKAASPLYDWRPMSTYIRRPPYWEGALAGERTLKGMRPLALLGDNITTDHLSPHRMRRGGIAQHWPNIFHRRLLRSTQEPRILKVFST